MAITIKAARVNANLTQKELAKRVNIAELTLQNYENYKTIPTIKVATLIAKECGLSLDDIIFYK